MKELAALITFSGMLIFSASCVAGPAVKNGTDKKTSVSSAAMLDAHNSWRKRVGVTELNWSPVLEDKAIAWAKKLKESNDCVMKHSGPGENLFWGSPLKTATKKGTGSWKVQSQVKEVSEQQVVDSWGSEIQWYSYKNNSCSAPAGKSCGHYTQLVWAETTEVGCGKAICSDLSQVWVCSYDPPGNMNGKNPY